MKSKLTKKEQKLLRRKLLHGGGLTLSQSRIHFTDTERLILSNAESKVDRELEARKAKCPQKKTGGFLSRVCKRLKQR